MTRWTEREETSEVLYRMLGNSGPIAACIRVTKPTLFGNRHGYFFVSKKVDWFHEYGRDYDDDEHTTGMMIRHDVAKRATTMGPSSTLAIFVESEGAFFGISALKYWNYVKAYGRVKMSPYEANVLDTACPKMFWKALWSNNKFDIAFL